MIMPANRSRGVTLIELLVVAGIIALLISILLPAARRVGEEGRSTTCRSNVRQLATGFHLYAQEHRGLLPGAREGGSWDLLLRPHVADDAVYACPSDVGDVATVVGLSYAWRDLFAVLDPRAAMTGRDVQTAAPGDLVLVFESVAELHGPDRIHGAVLDTSVRTYTIAGLESDLERLVQ